MDAFLPFLPFLFLAGGLAAVLGFFTWLAARVRRRGLAGGAMSAALASYEEAFRTTAHASHVEIRAQAERKAPLLSPDGHWGRSPGETGAGAVRAEAEADGRRLGRYRTRRSRRALSRWAARLGRPGR
ncbi:hypothetical protein [Streptomyces daliensis]|uniref:Secreted protein n=1 Tax=Streptomyces daliensis TaxID=299421 RepID=A0A8T4IRG8_9ACTN|nr:hypothetical protein [Streptomyces daliensis]